MNFKKNLSVIIILIIIITIICQNEEQMGHNNISEEINKDENPNKNIEDNISNEKIEKQIINNLNEKTNNEEINNQKDNKEEKEELNNQENLNEENEKIENQERNNEEINENENEQNQNIIEDKNELKENQELNNDENIKEEIIEKEIPKSKDNLNKNNETENMNNVINDNKNNYEPKSHEEQHIYDTDIEKNNKFKILFEKYLLSFHNGLLEYLPPPYDYLFVFILGYFFMGLFIRDKSSIYVKKKKKLIDSNVFQIEQKLREISKFQDKLKENKNNNKIKINLPEEEINIEKCEQIENKLNVLMNDLCERNNKDSKEKKLQNNICDLQTKILEDVNKLDEEGEGEEEEDEGEQEEEENKNK